MRGLRLRGGVYRPVGLVGPTVDPLGDEFIKLLPEGFWVLLAPALEPPALKFEDPDGACPVVVPFDIDPLGGAAPTPAVPLAPAPVVPLAPAAAPAAPPPPLSARASVLDMASANPSVRAFIFIACLLCNPSKTNCRGCIRSVANANAIARESWCQEASSANGTESRAQLPPESTIGLRVPAKLMRINADTAGYSGMNAMSLLRKFLRDESGATAIEYGLIAAGISLAIISVVNGLGTNLRTKFTSINTSLK
jgi:pilus assembly protein Flp/PilA